MCNCRPILGAFGRKLKRYEFSFVPDSSGAFIAGDALTDSPETFEDLFDQDNGSAQLVEYRVEHRHATTVVKKGIALVMFHTKPASAAKTENQAEDVSAIDFVKMTGIAAVATADYVDLVTGTETITTAIKQSHVHALPNVENRSTVSKRALWSKLMCTEGMTFAAGGLLHVVADFACD